MGGSGACDEISRLDESDMSTVRVCEEVSPHDDSSIEGADRLIRRVDPVHHVVEDKNLNCQRISTKLFTPSSVHNGGMSVDLERCITAQGRDPRDYVISPPHLGAVCFKAADARRADLHVGCNPLPENPCHGEVWGKERPNRFSKGQQNALLRAAQWLVELSGVHLRP